MDPEPPPSFPIALRTIFFLGVSQSLLAQGSETIPSLAEAFRFDPNAKLSLTIALISFVFGIVFFLVQTALGSVSKIQSSDVEDSQYFWEKGTSNPKLASRLFERRSWAGGIFCHLVFLVSATSFLLEKQFASVPIQIFIISPIIIFFQFVVFDLMIRQAAVRYCDVIMKWLARIAYLAGLPFHPIYIFVYRFLYGNEMGTEQLQRFVREREFRLLPHISHVDQIVEEEAAELMDSVRVFMGSNARDIMTPRTDIDGIELGTSKEDVIEKLHDTSFSRVVVYRDNLDHIVGFLLAKEILLNADKNPFDLMRSPVVADSETKLSDLLKLLKKKKTYLAVVADEYGGTSGIITLQDLFMAVMGNRLEDASDSQTLWIEPQTEHEFLLSGRVELWEANQELGTSFDEKNARTIGGYIMHLQGRLPELGEVLEDPLGSFEILKVENNRIELVKLVLSEKKHEADITEENLIS